MDISLFEVGDIIISPSKFVYEVMRFKYAFTKKRKEIEASICRNIKTGKEISVTWGKGKNIRFEKASEEEILSFKCGMDYSPNH